MSRARSASQMAAFECESHDEADPVEPILGLDRDACIFTWRRQFGHTPPKHVSLQFMQKALAYEAQLSAFGGHSRAVRSALELAQNGRSAKPRRDVVGRPPVTPVLRPGTYLVRQWNGRSYRVEVLENGFRMDGKDYASLSAIAYRITGTKWSGPRFFGLVSR